MKKKQYVLTFTVNEDGFVHDFDLKEDDQQLMSMGISRDLDALFLSIRSVINTRDQQDKK